jgi:predicted lysophospholipase L1 biosynthesis ABC-type transport system permease subunit
VLPADLPERLRRLEGVRAAAGLLAWLASKDLLPPGLAPRWATLAFAVVMGIAVSVAASLPGAFRAGRTPPLRTLRDGIVAPSRPLARAAVAGAVAVGGAALVLGGVSTAHGGRVVAGTGLCLVALVVGLPVVVGGLAGPLRRIGRPFGITVRLGAENAARNQRRTAATVAALIVGLATRRGRLHLCHLVAGRDLRGADWQRARRPHRPAQHRRGAGAHVHSQGRRRCWSRRGRHGGRPSRPGTP